MRSAFDRLAGDEIILRLKCLLVAIVGVVVGVLIYVLVMNTWWWSCHHPSASREASASHGSVI